MILFSSSDRNLTHQKLAQVLADGTFPYAFCQEDFNAVESYQVHHGLETLNADQMSKVDALIASLNS